MRVRNPQRLAELLLAEDQGWPAQRVAAAIRPRRGAEQPVNLGHKIPVHITYFTAAVVTTASSSSSPTSTATRARSRSGMEGKAHLIPKEKGPAVAEAIGSLAESRGPAATPRRIWYRVFGEAEFDVAEHIVLAGRLEDVEMANVGGVAIHGSN